MTAIGRVQASCYRDLSRMCYPSRQHHSREAEADGPSCVCVLVCRCRWVHKKHHEFKTPMAINTEYAHPLEHLVSRPHPPSLQRRVVVWVGHVDARGLSPCFLCWCG